MPLFSNKTPVTECGLVIDIGSGSVGLAIVVSDNVNNTRTVVWSHREYMLIKDTSSQAESIKHLNTTIVNALLELGSNGMKTLYQFDHKAKVTHIQTALCAPWAYTITKTINYEDEHPVTVTNELIKELMHTASKQTMATCLDGKLLKDLDLHMLVDATVHVEINGYAISDPVGHEGRSVALSNITAFASEKIIENTNDSLEKILPKANIEYYSFMFLFFLVLRNLHPDTSEVCLVDVTNEATEIGIVRDNVLLSTSHIPFGMYSLAREIAAVCNIPKEEAYTYLKDGRNVFSGIFSKEKEGEIKVVFEAYEQKIAELFTRTGDELSIPKTIFLHTSEHTEEFFADRIKKAAKLTTNMNHVIHPFTQELLGDKSIDDSALALSAHYFHMRETYGIFKRNIQA